MCGLSAWGSNPRRSVERQEHDRSRATAVQLLQSHGDRERTQRSQEAVQARDTGRTRSMGGHRLLAAEEGRSLLPLRGRQEVKVPEEWYRYDEDRRFVAFEDWCARRCSSGAERRPCKTRVGGSNPSTGLCKRKVAGSIPAAGFSPAGSQSGQTALEAVGCWGANPPPAIRFSECSADYIPHSVRSILVGGPS